MRTIILLILLIGQFPDWMWPVTCIWYGLSCTKWWVRVFRSDDTNVWLIV